MSAESGEGLALPTLQERLADILHSECVVLQAAARAIERCNDIGTLPGIHNLHTGAVLELCDAKDAEQKSYLFAYVVQVERIIRRLKCDRIEEYDA